MAKNEPRSESEPKVRRFDVVEDGIGERPDGGFVRYTDYARLAAEVEKADKFLKNAHRRVRELKADRDRLREALEEVRNIARADSSNPTIRSLHSWVSEALTGGDDAE